VVRVRHLAFVAVALVSCAAPAAPSTPHEVPPPAPFVEPAASIAREIRYAGSNNFVGRPIAGYGAARCWLTREAAAALEAVQQDLAPRGLGLLVYDCYRPARAVGDFVTWAGDPTDDKMKAAFYPKLDKRELLPGGYIAEKSSHSRGSTVDLTLITLPSATPADMGTPYDFFDPSAATDSTAVPSTARANRALLREAMSRRGFDNLPVEWWHYTLRDEPYPDTSFDLPIE
jgi:zinc D-Ala-D-Ala dipeptidase